LDALDLSPLQVPAGTDPQELVQLYQQLLAEQAVLYCAGPPTAALLQLLFNTACLPGLASHAPQVGYLFYQ